MRTGRSQYTYRARPGEGECAMEIEDEDVRSGGGWIAYYNGMKECGRPGGRYDMMMTGFTDAL
jgi:hypothetical protein